MKKSHAVDGFITMKGFDLNLLNVFEAVYLYGSVTTTANVLSTTPAAISQALGRLRVYFGDPLFIRQGQGLKPTINATYIHEKLGGTYDDLVSQFHDLKNENDNENKNKLVINCSLFLATRILGPLIKIMDKISPESHLVHDNNNNSVESVDDVLTFRKADIVFDVSPHSNMSRNTYKIYEEQFVAVCSQSHPRLKSTLMFSDVPNERFVSITSDSTEISAAKTEIENAINMQRKFRFQATSTMAALSFVEQSDAVTFAPLSAFNKYKECYNLKMLETEFLLPSVPIYMVYNKSALNSPFFAKVVSGLQEHFSLPY
ncbi:LysR family transcriptional regulator [Buttiauxella ferragutiae ATCC 51602]|jgi:DNA-binding transcriptional LysR family regulator|uniref:LysR family transcriptional regulator n=1 Tax=Buttiauxella ferragutiae ATCC 51602 TaxID=1354252 RepID=A0ABX2W460_9ENTR|nr:LysR family transcriptional regulator [Buttiauxella ferragutiae]OAT25413.1 LysR family transcriptional regulator [Buttiauxella ferragutiae ATCC 51602]